MFLLLKLLFALGSLLGMALLLYCQKITWCPTNTGRPDHPCFCFLPSFLLEKSSLLLRNVSLVAVVQLAHSKETFWSVAFLHRFSIQIFRWHPDSGGSSWDFQEVPEFLGRICLRGDENFYNHDPFQKFTQNSRDSKMGGGIFMGYGYGWLFFFHVLSVEWRDFV